jgi:hypothetical protein
MVYFLRAPAPEVYVAEDPRSERTEPMRRRNLLILVALVAVALITSTTAMAAPASATNFKGKAAVYSRNADHYFVVSFTCSGSTLSGNWTYDVNSSQSFSGTLVESANACAQWHACHSLRRIVGS